MKRKKTATGTIKNKGMNRDEMMEIKSVVRRTMEESLEMYDEQWVTADVLCQRFQMFTKDWLKRYGKVLQPMCANVTDADGITHKSREAYPLHRIARMIHNGEIKQIIIKDTCRMDTGRRLGSILLA